MREMELFVGKITSLSDWKNSHKVAPVEQSFGVHVVRQYNAKQPTYTIVLRAPQPEDLKVLIAADDPSSLEVLHVISDYVAEGFVYLIVESKRTIESNVFEAHPDAHTVILVLYLDSLFDDDRDEDEDIPITWEWSDGELKQYSHDSHIGG